jgi:hypothetical protein
MHLIGQGIAKHVFEMLTVTMGKDYNKAINTKYKPTDEELEREGYTSEKQWPYTFNIPKESLMTIGKLIEASRVTVPTTFASKWENPIIKSGGKRAVDWVDILLYMVPTMFVPALNQERSKKPLLALTKAAALSLKWELDHEDLAMIER